MMPKKMKNEWEMKENVKQNLNNTKLVYDIESNKNFSIKKSTFKNYIQLFIAFNQ